MSKELATKIIKRYEKLKGNRANWLQQWNELANYILLDDKYSVYGQMTPGGGNKTYNEIFDATGVHSNELLAGALHSMLTNPTSFWFGMETGNTLIDADDKAREWMQRTALLMHQTINKSNFQPEVHEMYLDLGGYGTGVLRVEKDPEYVVNFNSRPIFECVIAENSRGLVNATYRCIKWTLRQIIQEFGEEVIAKLPDDLQREVKTNSEKMEDELEVVHAVYERDAWDNSVPKKFRFASCYILKEKKVVLSESGYKRNPYVTPRWTKVSGEVYGRGPGMKALPDVKMLDEMARVTIQAAQLTIRPPMIGPSDGFMYPLDLTPDGFSYYTPGTQDEVKPLITGARVDIGLEMMADVRQRIRSAFFIDQLQLQEGPQMTATEVMQRTEEKLRHMGPILGRMQFEFLQPLLERVYDIMSEEGLIDPAPEILAGREVKFHFTSQIVKAQKTSELENLNRAMITLAPIVQVDPSAMDNLDVDGTFRYVAKQYGLPPEVLRREDKRDEIREQRAQAQEEAQQQQRQLVEAERIQKAGPTLLKANEQRQ